MDMVFFFFYNCFAISEFACRGEINSEVSIGITTWMRKQYLLSVNFLHFCWKVITFVLFGFMKSNQSCKNCSREKIAF